MLMLEPTLGKMSIKNDDSRMNYLIDNLGKQSLFNLSYSPKGADFSAYIKKRLETNPINLDVVINKLAKEFINENKSLVLFNLGLAIKLDKNTIDVIKLYAIDKLQAMNLHYTILDRKNAIQLNSLISQFPKEFALLQAFLELIPNIKYIVRQRYDMSNRGYGTQLYVTAEKSL